jgi:hypothetical protein
MFLVEYRHKINTPFISQSRMALASENRNPLFRSEADITQMGLEIAEKLRPSVENNKNNNNLTKMGKPLPEKQTHTITNPSSVETEQKNTNTKKIKLLNSPQQQTKTVPLAEQQSVKLFFNNENDIPSSFAIETSSANTRIEFSFGTPTPRKTEMHRETDTPLTRKTETGIVADPPAISTPKTVKTLKKVIQAIKPEETDKTNKIEKTAPLKKPPQLRPLATLPIEEREPWMEDALEAADYLERKYAKPAKQDLQAAVKKAIEVKKPISEKTQPTAPVCGGDDNKKIEKRDKKDEPNKPDTPKKAAAIPLPSIVGEENYNACNRHFNVLDNELKKKLVMVFNYNLKTRTVNNPAGYFITLAKSAAEDGLTVPPEAIVRQPPTPEKIAAAKEKAYHMDRWSDFAWLQQNAALQKMEVEALAKQMGGEIEEAYAMFAHTLK